MRRLLLLVVTALVVTGTAQAHVIKKDPIAKNFAHAKYVCAKGTGKVKQWHCGAVLWIRRELRERYEASIQYWIDKQIRVATLIAVGATIDPWPNCPDPYFNRGSSWQDTVRCENKRYYELFGFPRAWLDSPGYFRCGLQFQPSWETKYGRLCP